MIRYLADRADNPKYGTEMQQVADCGIMVDRSVWGAALVVKALSWSFTFCIIPFSVLDKQLATCNFLAIAFIA